MRALNLIPFHYDEEVSGLASKIAENALLFVPFVCLCLAFHGMGAGCKVLTIALSSLILEVLQYVLAVGASGITDLL